MLHRLTLLLVLLQCGGPSSTIVFPQKVQASYMKYVPGAGGGKGITFRISTTDSIPDLKVTRFEVNGITLPTSLYYRDGNTFIEASKFYAAPEPSLEDEHPEPPDPVLFNQEDFTAVLFFTHNGQPDSIHIREFQKEESPLYP